MRRDVGGWLVRWDPGKAEAFVRAGAWANKTVAHHLADRLADDPDHVCVIEGARVTTLREIDDRSSAWPCARAPRHRPGDTISFQLPNWREAVVIGLAAAKAGLVLGPITPIYRDAELSFMLRDGRSRLLFVPQYFRNVDYLAMARRVRERTGVGSGDYLRARRGWGLRQLRCADRRRAKPAALPSADPNAVKLVMYTSGTTGRAKGVLHSHNSLQAENWMRQQRLGIGPRDVLSILHRHPRHRRALFALHAVHPGRHHYPCRHLGSAAAVSAMREHRATGMIASTIFLEGLLAEAKTQDEHLHDLRFTCAAAREVRQN